jgi:hypothetical protein
LKCHSPVKGEKEPLSRCRAGSDNNFVRESVRHLLSGVALKDGIETPLLSVDEALCCATPDAD